MPAPDPKKLLFIYSDRKNSDDWLWREDKSTRALIPNATMHELQECGQKNSYACMLDTITSHVREHGTLKELMIHGHGSHRADEHRNISENPLLGVAQPFSIPTLLSDIGVFERENHIKVADRIVFSGCNIFTDLPPEAVKYYRSQAQTLKTEIVGTTATSYAGGLLARTEGRFVQFTPQGDVVRDRWDDPVGNWLASLGGLSPRLNGQSPHDTSWLKCHLRHTQEEGAQCQEKLPHPPAPIIPAIAPPHAAPAAPAFPRLKIVCEHAVDAECRAGEFADAPEAALPLAAPGQAPGARQR